MLLSVFTPTYNRAHTLGRLYESLCRQTCIDFEWVVVDDGSTDDTEKMVDEWIAEGKVNINYFYQMNSGKSQAHNKGVELSKGDLFVCVDSDDYLSEDAVERVLSVWPEAENAGAVGILAFRVHSDGSPMTVISDSEVKLSTLRDAYKKHGLSGDTMLVFRRDIISKYSFPVVEGEKFIPEGYIYNRIDKDGKLYILREGLYFCEYLPDGYTSNVNRLLFNNHKGYILHINDRLKNVDSGFREKLMDSIRYDSLRIAHGEKKIVSEAVYPFYAFIGLLPGYIVYLKRYRNLRNG